VSPEPNRAPEGTRSALHRRSRLPALLAAIALLAGGGALLLRSLDRAAPPPPAPPAPATAAAPEDPELPPGPEGAPPAPATIRSRLEAVSPDPSLRKLLAQGDVVRRWAVVAAALAAGESPRRELAALAPPGKFSVEDDGGRAAISAASYARYDAFGDAVASVDAEALAAAWRALRPALQAAYRALGYPYPSVDAAMLRALRRLEQAPVRDGPVHVVADEGVHVFADPRLEALGDVEKHLLRMGPRNARLVQAKARELEAALALGKPRAPADRR
jgi:hypothetical protein